jgi:hypothetical protein
MKGDTTPMSISMDHGPSAASEIERKQQPADYATDLVPSGRVTIHTREPNAPDEPDVIDLAPEEIDDH